MIFQRLCSVVIAISRSEDVFRLQLVRLWFAPLDPALASDARLSLFCVRRRKDSRSDFHGSVSGAFPLRPTKRRSIFTPVMFGPPEGRRQIDAAECFCRTKSYACPAIRCVGARRVILHGWRLPTEWLHAAAHPTSSRRTFLSHERNRLAPSSRSDASRRRSAT